MEDATRCGRCGSTMIESYGNAAGHATDWFCCKNCGLIWHVEWPSEEPNDVTE